MARAYANDQKRLDRSLSPGLLRLLVLLFGVGTLVGLTSGVVWIAYNLVRLHVVR